MHTLIAKMTPHTKMGVLALLAIAIVVVNAIYTVVMGQFYTQNGTFPTVNMVFGAFVGVVAVVAYNVMVNRLDREKYMQEVDFMKEIDF